MYSDRSGIRFYTGPQANYIPQSDNENTSFTNSNPDVSVSGFPRPYGIPNQSYTDERYPSTQSKTTGTSSSQSDSGSSEKIKWSYRKVVSRFAERTSMQGIPYIHASKTWYAKVMWCLIFLAGTTAMVLHLYYLCNIYFQYPKQTKVTLGYSTLNFPAVTICNVNPVKSGKAKLASQELQNLLESIKPSNVIDLYQPANLPAIPLSVYPNELQDLGVGFLDKIQVNRSSQRIPYNPDTYFGGGDWEVIGQTDQAEEIYNDFLRLLNGEPTLIRKKMGHDLKDMLIKCTFAGRVCHPENFTLISNSHLGNCYTLQSPFFKSRRSGPQQGLELILFMENQEYIRGITNSNGAQVLVHEQDTVPHPYDEGIAVSSSQETLIGLQFNRLSRLKHPYGKCEEKNGFMKRYGVRYTRQACETFCEVNLVIDTCNCTDPFFDNINVKIRNFRDIPKFCQTDKETSCMVDVGKRYETGKLVCSCEDPCEETVYDKSLSSRQWPSSDYAKLLLKVMCDKKNNTDCANIQQVNERLLAQNFVKLNIYYQNLNYRNITETEEYEDFQFASDIGGTLGLWIGLSALSVVEVIQFVLELLSYTFCGRVNLSTNKDKNNDRRKKEERVLKNASINQGFKH